MITYASYLPEKTDIVNNAFLTGLGNCSFSILSGVAVFSVLGYMAAQQGVPVEEVSSAGVGLAFIVFPQAINALPGMNGIMGALFFICLLFAGLSSSMSILEVIVSSFVDKYNASRTKVLLIVTVSGFLVSLLFVTGAGLYILDIVDHFVNQYAITASGLIEIIFIAWFFNLEGVRKYANGMSDFTVGKWWNFTLKYMTPAILIVIFIFNAYTDFTKGYEGYPVSALVAFGGGTLLLIGVVSYIITGIKGSKEHEEDVMEGVEM